jgi:hypothetical protein
MNFVFTSVSLAVLAGTALAQPAPAKAPADKAPAAGAPAVAPKPPQPAAELVDAGKAMNGAWKCTGKADVRGTTMDIKATITHKVNANLNKMWIESNFVGTAAKLPPMKFTMYTTYDEAAKKFRRVSVNGMGGWSTSTGTLTDKKFSFEGEAQGPMGTYKMRHNEEMISPKEVRVTGELSRDGGKTWVFDHDATCKK